MSEPLIKNIDRVSPFKDARECGKEKICLPEWSRWKDILFWLFMTALFTFLLYVVYLILFMKVDYSSDYLPSD